VAAILGKLFADRVGDEKLGDILEVLAGDFLGDNVRHDLADLLDLGALGVASLLHLLLAALCEGDEEHAHEVPVGGLCVNRSLDKGLPFPDEHAECITGVVHAVEVCEGIVSLHILDRELDLPVSEILILLEIGEADLKHSTLDDLGRYLTSSGLVDASTTNGPFVEHAGSTEVEPLLLGEWILHLLSAGFTPLRDSFVFSSCHGPIDYKWGLKIRKRVHKHMGKLKMYIKISL
jgi:hypothetical protein